MSDLGFDPVRAFARLERFVSFSPSPPGTLEHERVVRFIVDELSSVELSIAGRCYHVRCSRSRSPLGEPAGVATLTNLFVRLPGVDRGRPPLLVGTHFDTRWIADRERSPIRRNRPIPGANDGGSGTACLLELARVLSHEPPPQDVVLAFFDGEDLGGVDGHDFCVGSRLFARDREPAFWPAAALVLDMVGGAATRFGTRAWGEERSPQSRELLAHLFELGRALGHAPFFDGDDGPVYSDQAPLLVAGIPSALLLDIEYPQWHTLDDTLEHCSAESLAAAGSVAEAWVRGLGIAELARSPKEAAS